MSDDFSDTFSQIKPTSGTACLPNDLQLTDFWAYAPTHQYLFEPCNTLWVSSAVDSCLPPQPVLDKNGVPRRHAGKAVTVKASKWLDRNHRIDQLTWAPGEPTIIEGRLADKGGWKRHPGVRCFNQFKAAQIELGHAERASRWVEHVRKIYPDDADHIVRWLAHRVQRPGEKLNHALVLGGASQIGKDTLLEPVKYVVGHWNWHDVLPMQLIGKTTDFLKSVILRVSEARDVGESGRVDRYGLYEHCKPLLAAPPDVVRVNEKYVREYYVANVLGMVVTTNYRDALFLPHDDRRHYVAYSECKAAEFDEDYWRGFWRWYYHEDGFAHVAAYLHEVDLSTFDPKAAPPKTAAFLAMVDRDYTPEEAELEDAICALKNPPALTIAQLAAVPGGVFEWLLEPKARRAMPHRLERCGYLPFRNANSKQGLWLIKNHRQIIYVREELSTVDKQTVALELCKREGKTT